MNKCGMFLTLLIWLVCILLSIKAHARQESYSPAKMNRDTLLIETIRTKISLERLLAETRNQIAQIEAQRTIFEKDFQDIINQVHIFRFNLRQKLAYLQLIQEQLTGYNAEDTLTYSRAYWEEFTEKLKSEFNSSEWDIPDETGENLNKIIEGMDRLVERLNLNALRHPLVKDAVTNLIDFILKKPLDPKMMTEASDGVEQLREGLSGTTWAPQILNPAKGSILGLKDILTKIDQTLESIEGAMIDLNGQIVMVSRLLDHRLAKLDTLIGSVQVIGRNLQGLERFDPTEVRQQLIFLRNQNQFIDYEHRVLKSYNGEIENAIKTKDWKTILKVIARQDPDFGELNLEQNAYVLFVGANEVNRHFLIHEERQKPSDYLYAINSLSAIWLEDNQWETYAINMSIEVLQSEFELTFGQFKSIFDARKRGEAIPPEPTLFFYGMNRVSHISSPAKINLSMRRELLQESEEVTSVTKVEEVNDVFNTSYKIHERSLAHVSVGLAAGLVKKSNFVIEGKQLKISTSGDKELDQHLYALVNFHLGARDVDRFDQYPVLSLRKMMLQTGITVSESPLDRIYLGFGYRVLKDVQIDLLYYWRRNEKSNQVVTLDDSPSLNDAKQKFDKIYQPGNFAIGLSFYPQRLFRFLGL